LVLYGLLLLLAAGLFLPRLRLLGAFLSGFILALSGLLGVLILVMWFGTDHQACAGNFNLLWALPTNLMFVFRRRQYKYAAIALLLIFLLLIVHLSGIQQLLLPDMVPLLLMLVLIFATSYRKYKNIHDGKNPHTA
ncbi:MAG: hypothetical protein JNL13_13970, partial [Chitinophagaceae bacterium]|nr:hypothetical protein [Chitinophagaceae bacterium]